MGPRASSLPSPAGPSRRRVATAAGVLGGLVLASLGMVALLAWLLVRLSWPHQQPLGEPEFGINFSCNYAEYLLLEEPGGPALGDSRPGRNDWCAATLGLLLNETGARHVRLSLEWSQVEAVEGAYDFSLLDALLDEAERRGASVLMTVGMKAQRHPEYYIPEWLLARERPPYGAEIGVEGEIGPRTLAMVRAAVAHLSSSPAIESWGADNEPFVTSARAQRWGLSRELVQAEIAAIRDNDPKARPVSVGHAQIWMFDRRGEWVVEDGDVLAVSIYPFRNFGVPGRKFVVPILEFGPLTPNYPARAAAARQAGRDFWITEMQAEPWSEGDPRLLSPANPSPNLDAAKFRRNIDYARRSGASRVYLWGSEWWLFEKERWSDATWMELGRRAIGAAE